ncbi:uncharacterized protein [Venturia canescens]|uniref:uncharacterized protein n=1 Tax=Venturia canescens TaxID=32260 RepID=UPI001C9C0336|nr:uncharacterized protein LOC122415108 [Venturia canescens]
MDVGSEREIFCPGNVNTNDSITNSNCYTSDGTTVSTWTSNSQHNVGSEKFKTHQPQEYLGDELVKVLTWAAYRTYKYQPSDPMHYYAHQLLRWRYGDVLEKNSP